MPFHSSHQFELFNRLLEGSLSSDDTEELIAWLGNNEIDSATAELIMTQLRKTVAANEVTSEIRSALESRLSAIQLNKKSQPSHRIIFLKSWMRYAAAVIVLLGVGFLFFTSKKQIKTQPVAVKTEVKTDIQPGKQGAILTLSDGTTVVLDSLQNGLVATQNGSKILLNNGQLAYKSNDLIPDKIEYNTISTPRGRQFELMLPDGSKVWLNAASSLRYPTAFIGKERRVEINGEAYFEVAKNAKMPFHVMVNGQTEIQVLGTHFNINGYKNEANITTTLLEGSVNVFNGGNTAILKPGQQAQVNGGQPGSKVKVVNNANIEKVMAWKNGVFDFQDATLEEVMRQLERWYDIEVAYEKGIPNLEFMGKMGRDLTLSEVLRGLEVSKVHIRMKGRNLTVLP